MSGPSGQIYLALIPKPLKMVLSQIIGLPICQATLLYLCLLPPDWPLKWELLAEEHAKWNRANPIGQDCLLPNNHRAWSDPQHWRGTIREVGQMYLQSWWEMSLRNASTAREASQNGCLKITVMIPRNSTLRRFKRGKSQVYKKTILRDISHKGKQTIFSPKYLTSFKITGSFFPMVFLRPNM